MSGPTEERSTSQKGCIFETPDIARKQIEDRNREQSHLFAGQWGSQEVDAVGIPLQHFLLRRRRPDPFSPSIRLHTLIPSPYQRTGTDGSPPPHRQSKARWIKTKPQTEGINTEFSNELRGWRTARGLSEPKETSLKAHRGENFAPRVSFRGGCEF